MARNSVAEAELRYMERNQEINLKRLCKQFRLSESDMRRVWDAVFREKGVSPFPRRVQVPKQYTRIYREQLEAMNE